MVRWQIQLREAAEHQIAGQFRRQGPSEVPPMPQLLRNDRNSYWGE